LGRNFDFKFDVDESDEENDGCSDLYQGTEGFSEAETRFIRNLIGKNKKVACWIHFDGTGNSFLVPWGFDSDEDDYENEFLNDKYEKLASDLREDYKVGNLKEISGEEYGGSFVDYGASLGIFTTQGLLEATVPKKSEILSKCKEHLESTRVILAQSLLPLSIEYMSSQIRSTTKNSETQVYTDLEFNITNPSNSYLKAIIQLSCSNKNSNFSLSSASRVRYLEEEEDEDVIEYSFAIEGYSTITEVVALMVSGGSLDVSFDITYQVLLQGYDLNPQYSLLTSSAVSDTMPKSENEETVNGFSRSWYRSSGHHEGVAVGLISVLILAIFALIILFLVKGYKETDNIEANNDEVMSGYTIKEFSIEGFASENSFSGLKKQKDARFVNSSVELKIPLPSEKPNIKVEVQSDLNPIKKPEIHSKVNIPEKPNNPEHSFKPPSGSSSPKPVENIKISSIPQPYPAKLSKDSPKVAQNVFPTYKPGHHKEIDLKIKDISSESSSSSIEIIHDNGALMVEPPQFGKGGDSEGLRKDWDKQGSQSFGQPGLNVGLGQMKVEEHLTFNSNSSSSSSSSSSSKSKKSSKRDS